MPNKKSQKSKRRMPKRQSPMGSNPSSHCAETGHCKARHFEAEHSKARCSEASYLELEAERSSPVPSREASEDHSEAASDCKVLLLAFRWSCFLFVCSFGISFAIVPEVSITLVMHLTSCDFWGML